MQQQISFLDSEFGKTSPERSAPTRETTSEQCSKPSAPSVTIPYMCLDLRTGYGNLLGAYWETVSVSHGKSMTLSTGQCRKGAKEFTLSQILQQDAPEKYSLSPRACAGIIRRAQKRGKVLPDMLREALMEVIGRAGGMEMIDEEPEDDIEETCEEDEDE